MAAVSASVTRVRPIDQPDAGRVWIDLAGPDTAEDQRGEMSTIDSDAGLGKRGRSWIKRVQEQPACERVALVDRVTPRPPPSGAGVFTSSWGGAVATSRWRCLGRAGARGGIQPRGAGD